MSTDVTVETTIGRPRSEVWRYTTDWRNDPTWIGAVDDAKLCSVERNARRPRRMISTLDS